MTRAAIKPFLIISACIALIAAAAQSIYRTQFAAPPFNVDLHRAVGRALAGETAKLLNNSGKVVLISIDLAGLPELKTQLSEFEKALKQFPGITIKHRYPLETDDKPKYSFGAGLSGRRYVRIVNKNPGTDAFVSFVGAPRLSDSELAELKSVPHLVAESRSADKLRTSFDQKILDVAVVSRFQFPTPVKGTPHSLQDWFDQRWQVVTTNNAPALPAGKDE